jgi:Zn-dependent protease with chaperone function
VSTGFFANQERARAATSRLVVFFALAVAGIVGALNALVYAAFFLLDGGEGYAPVQPPVDVFVYVTGIALVVIGLGTMMRMVQIARGGRALAELLGGKLVSPSTKDLDERKLLNVVEEMAIASGVSVPDVYVLEDESINAFAAGLKPSEAVIGVTRGCMRKLTRDELQGVVAHEFSHIFNGDMRLNLRLVGVLAGIQIIGTIGYYMLRSSSRPRRSSKNDGTAAIVVLGLGMIAIGAIGVFFAGLIKAAVSRQREFLADASAVQYTRNPMGIGMALKKIQAVGSSISDRHAEEASHMFFGQALSFSSLFATHPPVDERLRQIDPGLLKMPIPAPAQEKQAADSGKKDDQRLRAAKILVGTGVMAGLSENELVGSIGNPSAAQLDAATDFLHELPAEIRDAAHESIGAQAVVCCLFLGSQPAPEAVRLLAGMPVGVEVERLRALVAAQGSSVRFQLLELALPALRQLSPAERESFLRLVSSLVQADGSCEIFEYALVTVLKTQLGLRARRRGSRRLKALAAPAGLILSALAHASRATGLESMDVGAAFRAAVAKLGLDSGQVRMVVAGSCTPFAIESALRALEELDPGEKERFVEACIASITQDQRMTPDEYDLLQAVCAVLECPLPMGLPAAAS